MKALTLARSSHGPEDAKRLFRTRDRLRIAAAILHGMSVSALPWRSILAAAGSGVEDLIVWPVLMRGPAAE